MKVRGDIVGAASIEGSIIMYFVCFCIGSGMGAVLFNIR